MHEYSHSAWSQTLQIFNLVSFSHTQRNRNHPQFRWNQSLQIQTVYLWALSALRIFKVNESAMSSVFSDSQCIVPKRWQSRNLGSKQTGAQKALLSSEPKKYSLHLGSSLILHQLQHSKTWIRTALNLPGNLNPGCNCIRIGWQATISPGIQPPICIWGF